MRTLFIGDLHDCFMDPIEHLIEELEPDLTVFLGDYFDNFDDTPYSAGQMARWLAGSIEKDDRIHLIGNHDLSYLTQGMVGCPGYTVEKAHFINQEIDLQRWRDRARIYHWVTPDLLVSHAGVSRRFIQEQNLNPDLVKAWLTRETPKAWQNVMDMDRPRIHPIWRVGAARSQGMSRGHGGLIWCDWDHEFEPVTGISQIVGHTPARSIRIVEGRDGLANYCIDTCGSHGSGPRQVLLWQHGQFEVITIGEKYHD